MWRNFITIAVRHFLRDSRTTLINIIGLSVGISAFFLIMLWVDYQLSFDDMHENQEHIYRVMSDRSQDTRVSIATSTPYPLGDVLRGQSGIRRVARVMFQQDILLTTKKFKQEQSVHYVDPDFLEMFSFKIVNKRVEKPLEDPYSIMLICMITIWTQVWRAARINPAVTLKSE